MKPRVFAIFFFLGCLLAAGCRTDRQRSPLEQENRQLEDALYEFQYKLETSQQETAALRKQLARYEPQGPSASRTAPRDGDTPERLLPGSDRQGLPQFAPLRPPTVERGSQAAPPGYIPETLVPSRPSELPDLLEPPPVDLPNAVPDEHSGPANELITPPLRSPEDRQTRHGVPTHPVALTASDRVARIEINREASGGFDSDGRPGDDGMVLVVEPRAADGQLVAAAAAVSVVALDPNLPGEAARVARWDFTADEVAQMYRRSPPGTGLRLKMTWPGAPPVNSRLHLFVRYTAHDQTLHNTDGEIRLAVSAETARDWSAAPSASTPASTSAASSQTASGWQGRPASLAPREVTPASTGLREPLRQTEIQPLRTASRPTARNVSTAPRRPTWSPER